LSILAFGGEASSTTQRRKGAFVFTITLALVAAFTVLLVHGEDPWALYRVFLIGIAYLVAITLSVLWLAESGPRKSKATILLVGVIVVVAGAYAFSAGGGYPANNVTSVTSYSCTTTSGINSAGINFSSYGCTENSVPVQNIPLAIGLNLIVWTPLVGCILYSMPGWNKRSNRYYELARLLGGSAIAAAILLNVVGIGWSGSLQSLPSIHMPLNPYPATGECDSGSADSGCVYVDQSYVLADYAFWLGVAFLASLAISAFASHRTGLGAPVRRGVLISLVLISVLTIGLVVIQPPPHKVGFLSTLEAASHSTPLTASSGYRSKSATMRL
jgi:hypothetical protein